MLTTLALPNQWNDNPIVHLWQIKSKKVSFCLAVTDSSKNGLVTLISKTDKNKDQILKKYESFEMVEKCPFIMSDFKASYQMIKSMSLYHNDILKAVIFLANILKT